MDSESSASGAAEELVSSASDGLSLATDLLVVEQLVRCRRASEGPSTHTMRSTWIDHYPLCMNVKLVRNGE